MKKEVFRAREATQIEIRNLGFIVGLFAGHHSKPTGWLAGPSIIWMEAGDATTFCFYSSSLAYQPTFHAALQLSLRLPILAHMMF